MMFFVSHIRRRQMLWLAKESVRLRARLPPSPTTVAEAMVVRKAMAG